MNEKSTCWLALFENMEPHLLWWMCLPSGLVPPTVSITRFIAPSLPDFGRMHGGSVQRMVLHYPCGRCPDCCNDSVEGQELGMSNSCEAVQSRCNSTHMPAEDGACGLGWSAIDYCIAASKTNQGCP